MSSFLSENCSQNIRKPFPNWITRWVKQMDIWLLFRKVYNIYAKDRQSLLHEYMSVPYSQCTYRSFGELLMNIFDHKTPKIVSHISVKHLISSDRHWQRAVRKWHNRLFWLKLNYHVNIKIHMKFVYVQLYIEHLCLNSLKINLTGSN